MLYKVNFETILKILILGSAYPFKGGLATFNERLAEELNKIEGIDVEIYTFTTQYPKMFFPGKTQFSDENNHSSVRILRKISSINPFNWIQIANEIKAKSPSLIIVKYWLPFMAPCFGTILSLAKKNTNIKVISILDNVIPHEKRLGDRLLTQYFINSVDGFISMSHEVLNDLRKFDKTKPAFYSPHPIYDNYGDAINKNMAKEILEISDQSRVILFFGFIRKYKGLDILMEAMTDQRIKNLGIKLIIAGEFYEDENFYKQKIKKLDIENQLILYTDFIPNKEVNIYFSAADCVVQPYKSATQSGISQIAYHFDKPMIVTNVGGLPEIVPNEKVGFVTEITAEAIADAIIRFYEEDRAEEFRKNIIVEKKKYSWEYFKDEILNMYNYLKDNF